MITINKGLNIYKILCAFGIVLFHATYKGVGYSNLPEVTNPIFVSYLMLGEIAVNGFFLISGYFLKESSFKLSKLVNLLGVLYFYKIVTLILNYQLTGTHLTGKKAYLEYFEPSHSYWFFTVYVIVYIFSPYVVKLYETMTLKENQKFIWLNLIVWFIVPSILGLVKNNPESYYFYNRLILGFVVNYIGLHLNRSHFFEKHLKKTLWALVGLLLLLSLWMILLPKLNLTFILAREDYWWRPNNLFTLGIPLALLGIAMKVKIPAWFPNLKLITASTLGIYLFHDSEWNKMLWHSLFKINASSTPLKVTLVALEVFFMGLIIELIRQQLFKLPKLIKTML